MKINNKQIVTFCLGSLTGFILVDIIMGIYLKGIIVLVVLLIAIINHKRGIRKQEVINKMLETIGLRCRATKCINFDKKNGCEKEEIIISTDGTCKCFGREIE